MSGGVGLVAWALCLGWNSEGCRYVSVNRESGEDVVYTRLLGALICMCVYRVCGTGRGICAGKFFVYDAS